MKKSFLAFLGLLIIQSCTNHVDKVYKEFPKNIELAGTPVSKLQIFSKSTVKLLVLDTFLVVDKANPPFFQIYNTNNFELLFEFGQTGNGPLEFGRIPTLLKQRNYGSIENKLSFSIFDAEQQRITIVNIPKLLAFNAPNFPQLEVPSSEFFFQFYHYDEDFLLAQPEGINRLFIQHLNPLKEISVPPIPFHKNLEISESIIEYVYSGASIVNKEKKLIASAPYYLGQLDFFDLNGKHVNSNFYESPQEFKEHFAKGIDTNARTNSLADIKNQTIDLDADENHIFALNANNLGYVLTEKGNRPIKILVFDWEGNSIIEYQINDRLITNFTYDKVKNCFYAWAPNEELNNIIIYNIPKIN